jgi:hypothetical protein
MTTTAQPQLNGRWLVAAAAFGALVALSAFLVLTAGDDPQQPQRGGTVAGFASSGPHYGSLAELTAKSNLVVLGTVKEVLPGEIDAAGTPEAVEHTNTAVRVDEVLKGSASREDVVTVKTLDVAFGLPDAAEWRSPGTRVLLFLSPSRETAGLHILANTNYSQTAYIVEGENVELTLPDEVSERIATLSVGEIRQAVKAS